MGKITQFSIVQSCTEQDVERLRQECESISDICFSSIPTGKKFLSYFRDSVCGEFACVKGMLKGPMFNKPKIADWSLFLTVLRCLVVIGIISFVVVYTSFDDWFLHFSRKNTKLTPPLHKKSSIVKSFEWFDKLLRGGYEKKSS